MRRLFPFLMIVLVGTVALAEDGPPAGLVEALEAFLAEKDPEVRAGKGFMLAASGATPSEVAAALRGARTVPVDAPKGTVEMWKRTTGDDVPHAVFANIPESYDPAKAWPVLIWLHGGVSRATDGGGVSGIRLLKETSDEEGFLLLSPSTRGGVEWWTPAGAALVRGALDDLKTRWHVDANRVAVSGFSDGASGCFHLLAHDPDPYCCFLAFMAHPGVTRLAGGPSFAANVRSRPVFAVNGGADALYPSQRIEPMIGELKKAGCAITWVNMPETGHDIVAAMSEHWETAHEFWKDNPRTLAKTVAWETALPKEEGRFGWVEILAVDTDAPGAEDLRPAVLPDPTGRPKLGIQLDMAHRGEGLKIREVQPDTPAFEAGFEAGDVLLAVDGKVLGQGGAAFSTLRRALEALQDRDGVFTVQRGEDEIELKTRPRVVDSDVERPADRGYDLPAGRIVASVTKPGEIQLQTRHVKRFKLHLSADLVDLAKPVRIVVNGRVRHEGKLVQDVGYLLTEAMRAGPGAPVFLASIVLVP